MKKLLHFFPLALLFLLPAEGFCQAPNLGTAANFILFSTAGAVTNTGISHLTGHVGTNSGSSTGFGNVDGVMHDNDGASLLCSTDLLAAYNQLNTAIPGFFPAPLLGSGDTLIAGVYHISSAATMSGNLVLNAQGNASAVFIFQIEGAFSTTAATKVKLINGGQACNVFWKVEGLVSMAAGTSMKGTIVAHNAAINMNANDTLEGRALSIAGAVTLNNTLGYTPVGCGSAYLTGPAAPSLVSTAAYGLFSANGPVTNTGVTRITGDVGTNLGLTTGFNPLFVAGAIHPIPDGSTAACAADLSNVYTYLNTLAYDIELLYPAQFGNDLVLTPHTYLLNAATTFTGNVYLNGEGNANAVFVIKINGALTTSTFAKVKLINGTQPYNVYWKVEGAVDINDNSLIKGTIVANNGAIHLRAGDTLTGRALSTTGAVTTDAMAIYSLPAPYAYVISGTSSVCIGSSITLTDTVTGGIWSRTNGHATITSGGVVTGVTAGIDTIRYIVTNTVGSDTATKIITINSLPNAGSISGVSAVCIGAPITLTDLAPGGTWGRTNANANVAGGIVSGITAGIDTIMYTVTNACGTATATKVVTVNAMPNAGVITGASSVCVGSAITLSDTLSGGLWIISNAHATLSGSIVNGITAGMDTVLYRVTNTCGTSTAIKIVTINPVPSLVSSTTPSPICDSTLFNYTPLSSVTGTSFTWVRPVATGIANPAGSGAANVSETLYNVTNSDRTATYVYTLAANGCSYTHGVTVTVYPTPRLANVTDTACSGSAFVFVPAGLTTGVLYSWTRNTAAGVTGGVSTGSGSINDVLTSTSLSPVNVAYVYTLNYHACSFVQNVNVTLFPSVGAPVISTHSPLSLLSGTMAQNFGTGTVPPAGVVYTWSASNATVWAQGLNHQYALVNFNTPGVALITLTSSALASGCINQATVAVTVGASIAHTATVNYFGSHFVCTPNDEDAYQWGYDDAITLDSTILTGEMNQNYMNASPDLANKYYWVMTSVGGSVQKTYYSAPTGVQETANNLPILNVYPNPASDNVIIEVSSLVQGQIVIEVSNMLGQKVSIMEANSNKAIIDVSLLPAGMYIVNCYQDGVKAGSSKFLKN